jgi:HNH endonuclease/NUMOD4 motif
MDEFQNSTEVWKAIPDWEGLYEVSNAGRVRRLHKHTPMRLVKSRLNRCGYPTVGLKRVGSRQQEMFVHRLVAAAFIGPLPEGHQVDHIDGYKPNNSPDNLEYVTPRENMRRGHALGLMNTPRGAQSGNAKLTEDAVRAIRASTESYSKIALRWNVGITSISLIRNRKSWKHVV